MTAAADVLRAVVGMCDAEIAEPWDEGSDWFARRVRAAIDGQPDPAPPSNRWAQQQEKTP